MSVGLVVSKTQLDKAAGQIAKDLKEAFDNIITLKEFLDSKVDADLTALGYTSGEVATLRSAYGDAAQLQTIFDGVATLGTAKDFKTFLKLLWGLDGVSVVF